MSEPLTQQEYIRRGRICKEFKDSPMYELLSLMMRDFEMYALNELSAAPTTNKDELYGLTLRWRERQQVRMSVMDQIDTYIIDGQQASEMEPDEFVLRSEV